MIHGKRRSIAAVAAIFLLTGTALSIPGQESGLSISPEEDMSGLPASDTKLTAEAPGTQASPSPSPVSAAADAVQDPVLVALGSLGASNLYYSYLTLGTVADGFVSGTYDAEVAISVANEAIFMNTSARGNLEKLLESTNLAQEDKDVVSYMIVTYEVLTNQARALVQFIGNLKDDGSAYQKYRTEAWMRIVDLFGIE